LSGPDLTQNRPSLIKWKIFVIASPTTIGTYSGDRRPPLDKHGNGCT
jgi:hypothetical protein